MADFTLARLDAILADTPDPRPVVAIETGTWRGDTTAVLVERFHPCVLTIDISRQYADRAFGKFHDVDVSVFCGDSAVALPGLLEIYSEQPTFLYLDAHHWHGHGGTPDVSPFPLWSELDAARACPWVRVVVVDDVYQMGRTPNRNPGWADATPERIVAVLGDRVTRHAIMGDQLVIWLGDPP